MGAYDFDLQGELSQPAVYHWVWFIGWSSLLGRSWVIHVFCSSEIEACKVCVTGATRERVDVTSNVYIPEREVETGRGFWAA